MRIFLLGSVLLMAAAPVAAQPVPPPEAMRIPPELTDPAMAEKLGDMMGALGDAFLDMPIGGIKAAAEGRTASPQEKAMTVRDMGRRDDPNFDANYRRQIAQAKPMIANSMRAMSEALPAMISTMTQAAAQMERVMQNMPRPDYPRR
ncbi:hypothetical protein H8M03_05780 [Sphingomonas sabuli]|uniref:Uncharacterized protein n=1 Tax=Sphingomonas sabuli TaxID=2764186 RepID=A0A7G9L5D0_9SPHN|nr:hypothetical protein [Sphingomonas sabuli]QNM83829.1 hypothetical protein H8M03_05780 [Sphingomonas sabuli]